mgnify:CR=1 FL=1
MPLSFIDLFSGIGGFRLGMEQAGHTCLGHCEIDKFAEKSYRAMHEVKEGEWYAADITKVRAEEIPKTDCWCFGFPCTNISIAGKQAGIQGKQSGLFFEVIRLLEETKKEDRPKWLFIENVRNLLSIAKGFDFAGILIALDKAGYDTQWQVLDSANFGVPQHRERLYIVGHIRGSSGREIFPIPRKSKFVGMKQIANILPPRKKWKNPPLGRIFSIEGISPTLVCSGGGGHEIKILTEEEGEKRIRKLTPKECFRLQGFPDEYFEKARAVNSDTQLYKQAGNSVTVPVIYEIAKRMEQ